MMDKHIERYQPDKGFVCPGGKKVVLVGGVFDVLHYGHMQFLGKARGAGDYLVVVLEPDAHVVERKKRQPIHVQSERAGNLAAIRHVDRVLLLELLASDDEYDALVEHIRPAVIAVTASDPRIENKTRQAKSVGADIYVVDHINLFSTTRILNSCCLRREYTGVVQRGEKKARVLGFPTANIHVGSPPPPGVYDGVVWLGGALHGGICYYDDRRPNVLEAHLFLEMDEFYGEEIRVLLGCLIRSPWRIVQEEELKELIGQDICHIFSSQRFLAKHVEEAWGL